MHTRAYTQRNTARRRLSSGSIAPRLIPRLSGTSREIINARRRRSFARIGGKSDRETDAPGAIVTLTNFSQARSLDFAIKWFEMCIDVREVVYMNFSKPASSCRFKEISKHSALVSGISILLVLPCRVD